jgi:hypothetical protein
MANYLDHGSHGWAKMIPDHRPAERSEASLIAGACWLATIWQRVQARSYSGIRVHP